ncbi:MAG TPA: mechanosensitive ion channel domain-containing protein [Thermoanaerobaculia bacterium]|nr:mechanosensitive ion channel domain-containing protein [Thermoanaerobaculia bacterium]
MLGETFAAWWERLAAILDYRILQLGETRLTLGKIAYLVLLVALVIWLVGKIKKWIVLRLLNRTPLELHARQATATFIGYALLLVGFMIVLQTAGIDLTTLNVLAGAIGVGIGLGLQEVANNFISGLIILFERPIKVGDRIAVGDVNGSVVEIRARSTTVLTNENIAIIVPNSKFITENVINWSYNDPRIRFHVPVGVAYGSDPHEVEQALLEAARSVEEVLEEPAPGVWFTAFGESSLNFELRAWTSALLQNRGSFISKLNFAIHDQLRARGIAIPFPQRDLHLRGGEVKVVVEKGNGTDGTNGPLDADP